MRRSLFLCLLVLPLAACRGRNTTAEDGEPSRDQVQLHTPPERDAGDPLKPPEWFDEEIANAQEEEREGLLRAALERVFRAREQNPGPDHAGALNALLTRLNEQVLEMPTLIGWVEPAADPIEIGRPLQLRVFFRNPGNVPVHVPVRIGKRAPVVSVNDRPGPEPSSRSVLVLEVVRKDYDVRAQVVTSRRFRYHPLERSLDIPPGGMSEIIVTLDDADNARAIDGVRVFVVGGQLRPVVTEVDGLRRWDPIRLEPANIRAFRANYEHLADDPVARIAEAITKNAPTHLLTAAALVPLAERRAAVDLLVEQLRGARAIDWAIFSALHYLTGIELARDPDAWRAWWARVRETFFLPEERARRDRPADEPDFG